MGRPLFALEGHVAVVTGANHGIGAAIAGRLARSGASVLITYLRLYDDPGAVPDAYRVARSSDASEVLTTIESAGGVAEAIEADLADAEAAQRIFNAAETSFGPVDILINNASGWVSDTFTTNGEDRHGRVMRRVSQETIDRQMAVDVRGAALLISEFASRHHGHGLTWGRIVGLTSGGPLGFPREVSYGAAKAALENYTMSAALELADRGVTANIVHPPVTDTGWITEAVREEVASRQELIHIAQPEDVADVIAYLVSEEAGLITGNILHLR